MVSLVFEPDDPCLSICHSMRAEDCALWHVVYHDGDEEDLEFDELQQLLVPEKRLFTLLI